MKGILGKHELWDIVTTASLDGYRGDNARMYWRKNAVALYLIRESCGSDRFSSIKGVDVAKEAWGSLVSANVPGIFVSLSLCKVSIAYMHNMYIFMSRLFVTSYFV